MIAVHGIDFSLWDDSNEKSGRSCWTGGNEKMKVRGFAFLHVVVEGRVTAP
jgi:hypothetical protein